MGWLSITGRARLRLARACAEPDATALRAKVERSLHALRSLTGTRADKARDITREVLLFLTWAAIRGGATEDAQRWLNDVDHVSPDVPERLGLRWELLGVLLARSAFDAYCTETRRFLTDPLVRVDAHGAAITEIIRAMYEDISPARCADGLLRLPPPLAQERFVQVALAVSQCPSTFASRDDAQAWAARTDPDYLGFSKTMTAGARIVRARAAEWACDWNLMESECRKALEVRRGHLPAEYWLARARLHRTDGDPLEGLNGDALFSLPQGARLRLQAQLHGQPTVAAAKHLLPVLRGKHGACDDPEGALNLQLLERALTSEAARGMDNLRACAEVSAAVAKAVARQFKTVPWLESNCALAEIQLDRDYLAAIRRLGDSNVLVLPLARQLTAVARLLAGMPPRADRPPKDPCLSALQTALQTLVSSERSHVDRALLKAVDKAALHPLVAQFPALAAATTVLRLALGVTAAGDAPRNHAQVSAPGDAAPPWAHWMYARALLADRRLAEAADDLDSLVVRNPATAWFLDAWWRQYGRDDGVLPAAFMAAQAMHPEGAAKVAFAELGPLCESACSFEAVWLNDLDAARASLAAGQAVQALSKLRKMKSRLGHGGPIVARTWDAASRYWIAVASAHASMRDAGTLLEELTTGPVGNRARVQMALLALQRHERETADRWLADLPVDSPAVLYTRALWHVRGAETDAAQRLLDTLVHRFAGNPSPYVPAAYRLRAALAERAAQPNAEQLHVDVLRDWPGDAIAAGRLARIRLRRGYAGHGLDDAPAGFSLPELFTIAASSQPSVQWHRPLRWLHDLLTCPDTTLGQWGDSLAARIEPEASQLPWIQVLARRWLQAGQPDKALKLYSNSPGAHVPAWHARASLILRSWHLLQELALAPRVDEGDRTALAAQAERLGAFCPRGDDVLVEQWHRLLSRAVELTRTAGKPLPPGPWSELGPPLCAMLPGLWSADPALRPGAATDMEAMLSTSAVPWSDTQHLVVRALLAWTLDNENAFLDDYAVLEPVLDQIPLDGPATWLAAARIHFRRKNWKSLLESDLPDCVSDLSHPGVRLVIGMAYAQAAVEDARRGDVRQAQQKVRQARSTLEALVSPAMS